MILSPPAGLADDDVMYACITLAVEVAANITPPTGFVAVTNQSVDYNGGCSVLYRKVASGESGSYTFSWVGGSKGTGILLAVLGADTVELEEATPATSSGSGTTPDPPASGTVTEFDYLALAVASSEGKPAVPFSVPPTNYVEEEEVTTSGAGSAAVNCNVSAASRELLGITSEDPGTFTNDAGDDWRAHTILINGVSSPPSVSQPIIDAPRPMGASVGQGKGSSTAY